MIRIKARPSCSWKRAAAIRIGAVLFALLLASAFLLLIDRNPLHVFGAMLEGAYGKDFVFSAYRVSETIRKAIPLVLCSVGISLAFKLRFWNIGAEGQMIMGAFASAWVALNTPEGWSPWLVLPLMVAGGVLGGGLWALIPAFFRARYRTNETILTLMLNYVALKWITYLQYGPWRDPGALGFPKIPNFADNAVLPSVFGIHIGWLFALAAVGGMYVLLHHTKFGYELSVTGESEGTARYAGMSVPRVIMVTLLISGGLCGLAGMVEASAVSKTLQENITGGIGYTAIITSWLAGLRAPMILLVCLLFAVMRQGATFIEYAYKIPQSAAEILQSLILFAILGSEFFIRYCLVLPGSGMTRQAEAKEA